MAHAFLARQDLDEGAKLLDGGHPTLVDGVQFDLGRHVADTLQTALDSRSANSGNRYGAIVLNIDPDIELFLHLPNNRATRTDDGADLLDRNHQGLHAWCMLAEVAAR